MLVDTILRTKGVIVHTLPDTGTLADAVTALNQHNIGALVITDTSGGIVGMLSERDIVHRLGSNPADALNLRVADCMVRDVVTGTMATSVDEVMERMTDFHIRHMPIVEDGRLVGIISIGDVVKSRLEAVEQEASALREYIAS